MPPDTDHGRPRYALVFVVGALLGVAGTLVLPRSIRPLLPGSSTSGRIVQGQVVEKVIEGDRLLLKVQAPDGSFLATFVRRQKDVNLLVDRGDLVSLQVEDADPFPVDPDIASVRKPSPASTGADVDASSGAHAGDWPAPADTTAPAPGP